MLSHLVHDHDHVMLIHFTVATFVPVKLGHIFIKQKVINNLQVKPHHQLFSGEMSNLLHMYREYVGS